MPSDSDLASRLVPHIAEARAAWPGVVLPDEAFVAFVAERLEEGGALSFVDLYLACACARRDPVALDAFEKRYTAEIRAAHARMKGVPFDGDEAVQRLRQRLFVDEPPAIATYGGKGSLLAWLRVVATRMLLNAKERETKERAPGADFFEAIVASDDGAELALLKKSVAADLKTAILGALDSLTNRDKSLLRYAYCDERNVDDIADVYRVHRATAARWVVKARERLVEETYARLKEKLGASNSEIRSIVRLGMGVIDTTFAKHLAVKR
jgi:RNA polymerase sigma-70 factor (ECF subfamily)